MGKRQRVKERPFSLARQLRERAIAEKVTFGWVAADSIYGIDDIGMALRRMAKGYVPGVNPKTSVWFLEQ
jgi:SRSO17 transposase